MRRRGGPTPLGDVLRDLLVSIAMREDDPAERDARLDILRKDGFLPSDNGPGGACNASSALNTKPKELADV